MDVYRHGGEGMPDYRRTWIPGGRHFFAINLLERRSNDLLVRHVDVLREAVCTTKRDHLAVFPVGWYCRITCTASLNCLPGCGLRFAVVGHQAAIFRVSEWPHSTFHRCVRDGIYPEDWVSSGDGALLPHDVWRQLLVIRRTVKLSALRWLVLPCERQR